MRKDNQPRDRSKKPEGHFKRLVRNPEIDLPVAELHRIVFVSVIP
ncbi:hypothetical protein [Bradyrhizobium sp.]